MKSFFKIFLVLSLFLSSNLFAQFLHVEGDSIVDGSGKNIILRGMGLGGWMLQEGYMLQLSSVANPQHEIRTLFEEAIGLDNTNTFYEAWLENHVRKIDVDSLASWGFNSIRLPMHYNLYTLPIEEEPVPGENSWLEKGFAMTDSLLKWCEANEIFLILDLHAAPGGQGHDAAISDYNPEKPSLWESEDNKQKTIALWKKLAERYSDHPWIGGYDLINETNWGFDDPNDLNGQGEQNNIPLRQLLIDITSAIREVDTNHIVYIEGNSWANNYNGIFPPWDDNMVASFHKYWTVNDVESIQWMLAFREQYNIPLWLGESGENSNTWYRDAITIMERNNIGWAWWPMKKLGLNNVLEIKKTQGYQDLIDYWEGNGTKPTENVGFASLMELAENTKMENCIFHPDVVDAMIRQPYDNVSRPFKKHDVVDGYRLFAVDFDLGGNEESYKDYVVANYHVSTGSYTAWNSGWVYRNDGVDIDVCQDENTNGFALGWTEPGEWLQYSINVEESGIYDLNLRTASEKDQNKIGIYVNDLPVSQPVSLPKTTNWQAWESTVVNDVYLSQGFNTLRIEILEGEYNLNYIEFSGPRAADAVQPDLIKATVFDSAAAHVLLSFNQAFQPIDDFQAFSFKLNGSDVIIDTVHISEQGAQIIVLELSKPLAYGDFAYVSYNGTNVKTTNGISLDPIDEVPININFTNPLAANIVPGKIETENMSINNGFRTDVCYDDGGGLYTGWSDPNDYLIFDMEVLESGKYQITYRHAGQGGTGQLNVIQLIGDTEKLLETIDLNSTLGWQNWRDSKGIEIDLEKGMTQIKLAVVKANFNLNYLNFELVSVPAESEIRFLRGHSNQEGNQIILQFNKPIDESSVSKDGFALLVNGQKQSISAIELSDATSLVISIDQALTETDIIKVSYDGTGTIMSSTLQDLTSFDLQLIKNEIVVFDLLSIPGKIEVEDFSVNSGFEFEDCTDSGGGENAGYTDSGDYLDFDVNVTVEGRYKIIYRIASESAGGALSLQTVVNSKATTISEINFSATGGWQNWKSIEDELILEAGNQKIRLLSNASLFNINWIEFVKISDNVLGLNDEILDFKIFPNPSKGFFSVQFDDTIETGHIHIYDIKGRLVQFDISNQGINRYLISHELRPGIYLMVMDNPKIKMIEKLIVE